MAGKRCILTQPLAATIDCVLETGFTKKLCFRYSHEAARTSVDLFSKAVSPFLQLGFCNLDNAATIKLTFEEAQVGYPSQSFFPSTFCESPDHSIPFAETVAKQITDGDFWLYHLILVEAQETRFTVRLDNSAELVNCVRDFTSTRTATAFQPSVKASINGRLNFLFTPGKIKLIAC